MVNRRRGAMDSRFKEKREALGVPDLRGIRTPQNVKGGVLVFLNLQDKACCAARFDDAASIVHAVPRGCVGPHAATRVPATATRPVLGNSRKLK